MKRNFNQNVAIVLGILLIVEYSTTNANIIAFVHICRVAITFTLIGHNEQK